MTAPVPATVRQQSGLRIRAYGATAAMMPKLFLAYQFQIWFNVVMDIFTLVITVFFWRAVYGERELIGGLTESQTLNYVILARIFHDGVYQTNLIRSFGEFMREGGIVIRLLWPLDFQGVMYLQNLVHLGLNTMMRLPLAFLAVIFFQLPLPASPVIWTAFVVTMLLGHGVMFCFDWILGSTVLSITDSWGLSTARGAFAVFFSGLLIPLDMMPPLLRMVATLLPFSQAIYLPISVLSSLTPLTELPSIWLVQLGYLIILLILSRFVFKQAIRLVTVQGG
jgi:ABC-2 type transport system permease protein